MEPMLSQVATTHARNAPRDLQARLYREIGISAVAAALKIYEVPASQAVEAKAERREPRQAA